MATVSNENSKITYLGNGSATEFPSNFKIFNDSEALVTTSTEATGALTPLVLNTDYTIAGAGSDTFTVTTTSTYTSATKLIISRNLPYTQTTDLQPGDNLPANTIEQSFGDRNVMLIQQVKEEVDRCLKVGIAGTDGGTISTTTAGTLYWDGSAFSIVTTVIDTDDYPGDISRGVDAAKSANPTAGDLYYATDTKISYVCYTSGTWTANYELQLAASGTFTLKDSSGTTIATIDSSGNLRIAGTIEQGASF